jgi:hypothetical protein
MKNVLIILSFLVITIPIVIIIQNFTGWNLFSRKEYYILVLMFIIVFIIYQEKKDKKE